MSRRAGARAMALGLLLCTALTPTAAQTPKQPATKQPATTALSTKAAAIKPGMTRSVALTRLGAPTWAVLPTDQGDFSLPDPRIGVQLRWKNGRCLPVVVSFTREDLVNEVDTGSVCTPGYVPPEPPLTMLCSRADRRAMCVLPKTK